MTVFIPFLRKTSRYSIALLLLTSLHHAYGSLIYHTPWRLHVLFMSIPVLIIIAVLSYYLNQTQGRVHTVLLWTYRSITLVFPVLLIGVFEGLYNHVLKNILFFTGVPVASLTGLFPPGMYEMPDDWFFELTGVLQGVIAVILIRYFTLFTKQLLKKP